MSGNLFDLFRSSLPADLDRMFIEDAEGGRHVRYADMLVRTGRVATLLTALGVRPGDRVAVQVDKSIDALIVYLATLRAGAVFLPLNPAYVVAEVRYFLEDAEPTLLIVRPRDEDAMKAVADELGVPNLRTLGACGEGLLTEVSRCSSDYADVTRAGDDLAAILYTSGTTGRAKGAMLTHGDLRSNADTLRAFWRFTEDDRLVHALPIFHTHGLFVATNITLASGATLIFLPRFDVRAVIAELPSATVLMGVPTFYTRLLGEADFSREQVSNMRLFISGSAPLNAETHREFAARTGHAILERYGMTETNMITSNPYDGERVPGSVGRSLPGVEVRIADPETGKPVTDGPGSIEVRGPNVFKGYWRMPEKTAREFRQDGFFITGDLGYRDEKQYIYIAGRAKDLIISGGLNIYPAEVENAIDAIDGVAECAVVGVPHPDMGEAVVAVVRRHAGSAISPGDLSSALSGALARFKQPRRYVFVDGLPRNAMGKIQKTQLREAYGSLFVDETR